MDLGLYQYNGFNMLDFALSPPSSVDTALCPMVPPVCSQPDDDGAISHVQVQRGGGGGGSGGHAPLTPPLHFSCLSIKQPEQQRPQQHSESDDYERAVECYNCKVTSTPLWRRTPDRAHVLCNACGLYYKQYKRHRPVRIWQRASRCLGVNDPHSHPSPSQQQYSTSTVAPQQCANCHQTDTPLWRKNARGEPICNACGLFFKLHRRDRPVEMNKASSQRRRRRRDPPGADEAAVGLLADMSRDEMRAVLQIMEERCAFLKALLGNAPCHPSSSSSSSSSSVHSQQLDALGYM